MSIDALRGFDMLFIMGFTGFVINLCNLFPSGADCFLAKTMKHVPWNGLAHHDTIFPLFLFIAGLSFPFSLARQREDGRTERNILLRICRRGMTLVFLGLLYNGLLRLDFANLRVASVLGRIGLAWMFAAFIYVFFKPAARAVIAAVMLVVYWLLICYVPAPDAAGADPLSMHGCLVGYVDRLLLPGRLLYDGGRFDPEGLLSTVPAIVTAMLGMFTGEFVRSERHDGRTKAGYMGLASLALLAAGLLWSLVFPLNKMLWSSSFVLVVGAYSLALFALFYYLIDVKGYKRWTFFFRVIGMNSITIYMAQSIMDFSKINRFFLGGIADKLPPEWGAVILSSGYVAVCWLFLYFLYRKQVFLKV